MTCDHCGGPLPEGATARRRYCSATCRQQANRQRNHPPKRRVAGRDASELAAQLRQLARQLAEDARQVADEETTAPQRFHALSLLPWRTSEVMRAAVAADRATGRSWEAIGEGLGLHHDTVRRRWGPTDRIESE